MSELDGIKFMIGVEEPFPQVEEVISISTEPPAQPQSTVALAVTSSHS